MIFDFIQAALPWVAMGLLLAVFFARNALKKKDDKRDNYATEGMCLGMCFGVAIGSSFGNNTGIGISLGMLIGLAIGTCFKKEGDDTDEDEQ